MTDTTVMQFQAQQLRLKNIWKSVEFLGVVVMIVFVNGLLPQLLIQYVYASQELMETPKALELIPLISFIIGVMMFLYVMIGNLRREAQARSLEANINGEPTIKPVISGNVNQLQAAMKSLENKTERTGNGRKTAKMENTRATRSKKVTTKRKSK